MNPKAIREPGQRVLGRQNTSSPQFRLLQSVHLAFASSLETSLSSFLQTEIQARLGEISAVTAGGFQKSLGNPACVIVMRLHPRPESIILHFPSVTVFSLLELLLGAKEHSSAAASRELTEIEWSLFEEVVRVVVRPLGESWRVFGAVEFAVESLQSDPSKLPCPNPGLLMVKVRVELALGEENWPFEIVVPQAFFEVHKPQAEIATVGPIPADLERNLHLLEDAEVELEVSLRGPMLEFQTLLGLEPGQVLKLDYPLHQPLHAAANGIAGVTGHLVSAGRKRAFQVEDTQ